jgi:hypothetical protein
MPMRFGQDPADVAGAMGNGTDEIEAAVNMFEKESRRNRSFKKPVLSGIVRAGR